MVYTMYDELKFMALEPMIKERVTETSVIWGVVAAFLDSFWKQMSKLYNHVFHHKIR